MNVEIRCNTQTIMSYNETILTANVAKYRIYKCKHKNL